MQVRRGLLGLVVVAVTTCCAAMAAAATGPVGALPKSNVAPHPPGSCYSAPRSATCTRAAVEYLNKGRARLGQPAYELPANFAKLTPQKQVFILANLDRIRYKLPPISGLTKSLNHDAHRGVRTDNDPTSSNAKFVQYTSNWAAGLPNIIYSYGGWMYNDGPGSGNLDCTAAHLSRCWSHRKDILWRFARTGPSAMGVAAGKDRGRTPSYAMILGNGKRSYHPAYIYTWKQAKADGAGRHS